MWARPYHDLIERRSSPFRRLAPWLGLLVVLAVVSAGWWAIAANHSALGGSDDPNATADIATGAWTTQELPGWTTPPEGMAPEVSRRVLASVGKVNGPWGSGSGWIARRGVVITNNHVVQFAKEPLTFSINGGPTVDCKVIGRTRNDEIAALSCPTGDRPALPLRTDAVGTGTVLLTVGYPMGAGPAMSVGEVSDTSQEIAGIPALTTTAVGAPGSSGSPMVDGSGRVIGMVTWGIGGSSSPVSGVRVNDVEPLVTDPDGFSAFHGAETSKVLWWGGVLGMIGFALGAYVRYRSGYEGALRRGLGFGVGGLIVGLIAAMATTWLDDPSRWM